MRREVAPAVIKSGAMFCDKMSVSLPVQLVSMDAEAVLVTLPKPAAARSATSAASASSPSVAEHVIDASVLLVAFTPPPHALISSHNTEQLTADVLSHVGVYSPAGGSTSANSLFSKARPRRAALGGCARKRPGGAAAAAAVGLVAVGLAARSACAG